MSSNRNRRRRRVHSGDEERMSPTATIMQMSCYSRESESPRSDQFSDNETTSRITEPYRNSSDSEDEGRLPYAGAKFNSPPPAYLLPIPPTSWITASQVEKVSLNAMSSHLRQILKVTV